MGKKNISDDKGRIRKTVSFKKKIYDKLMKGRGKKTFSTHLNDVLEEKL